MTAATEQITGPEALAHAVAALHAATASAAEISDPDDRCYRQTDIGDRWLQLAVALAQYQPLTPRPRRDDDPDPRVWTTR